MGIKTPATHTKRTFVQEPAFNGDQVSAANVHLVGRDPHHGPDHHGQLRGRHGQGRPGRGHAGHEIGVAILARHGQLLRGNISTQVNDFDIFAKISVKSTIYQSIKKSPQ